MTERLGLSASLQIGVRMQATLSVKSGLAVAHLQAAALFARRCGAIERLSSDSMGPAAREDQRSFALGAVVCAAAFLEAAVNELYLAAVDRSQQVFEHVDKTIPELLAQFLPEVQQKSALLKYQTALILARVDPLPIGQAPYQDAASLFALRNALIHFKPEWDTALDEHAKLEQRLAGKFAQNPFAAPGDSFFPKRCLGFGCADWAVETAKTFYSAAMKRAGFWTRDLSDPARYGTSPDAA